MNSELSSRTATFFGGLHKGGAKPPRFCQHAAVSCLIVKPQEALQEQVLLELFRRVDFKLSLGVQFFLGLMLAFLGLVLILSIIICDGICS